MQASTFTMRTPDGTEVFVNRWLPDGPAKAVVQLAHGMAEHSSRYARFAQRLTDNGYAVYAADHRGHGRTGGDEGFFAETDGWNTLVADQQALVGRAKEEQPGLPVFLLGHSMGSFLARSYAVAHGSELTGLVLTSTVGDTGLLGKAGLAFAKAQARLRGPRRPSPLLDTMSFGRFNGAFKPNRTEFDWLSRDEAEVDAYIADPKCGFVFSAQGYADWLGGLAAVNTDAVVATIPKTLPILLEAGSMDQASNGGKDAEQVAAQLRRHGVKDVTVRIWPEARHEILNETNRDEVEASIVDWLDAHLPQA